MGQHILIFVYENSYMFICLYVYIYIFTYSTNWWLLHFNRIVPHPTTPTDTPNKSSVYNQN